MEIRHKLSNDAILVLAMWQNAWQLTHCNLDPAGRHAPQTLETVFSPQWLKKRFKTPDEAIKFIERKIQRGRSFNWNVYPLALDGSPPAVSN
jgi:hypothetical protein